MSDLLRKDITIRIISVLFAVFLWFFVLDNDNPIATAVVPVPLKVINEDDLQEKGIILKNKDYTKSIEVLVKGRKDRIKNITANDFEAFLDFSKIKSAEDKSLALDGPTYVGKEDVKDIQIWDVRPGKTVKLDLEKKERNPFKVEVVTTGKMKENYKIIKTTVNPEILPLEGSDSQIKSVATIKTLVDVTNLDKDLNVTKKECRVYNKNDEEIKALSRNLFVDIKIEVAKEVPVLPVVKGKPAKNYIDGAKKVKPDKVLITGAPEVLAKISELRTAPVDIENMNTTMDVSKQILLPDGVKLAGGFKEEAAVSVVIEQLVDKELNLSKDDINIINTEIDNSLKYEVATDTVKLMVKGNKADLDKMDVASVKPSVDVMKLGEGVHKLPLKVTLPANAKLIEEISVEVKIEKR
ncbi:MAG: CdaR family protein [Clostridia bacterium]|nr:CdaR family protein [Clostridia bacterium]